MKGVSQISLNYFKGKIKNNFKDKIFIGSFVQSVLLCISTAFIFFLMINFKLYLLIWIALVPIFYFGLIEKRFLRILFFSSFAGFLIFISFYWLSNYSARFFWLMNLIVSLFALFIGLIYYVLCKIKISYNWRFLFYPLIWMFFIILFSFFEYGNRWLLFAYFQPMMYPLGHFLGPNFYTVFIILFNALLAQFFYSKNKRVLLIIVIFLVLIIFSLVYSYNKVPEGSELKILLVQGNVDLFWEVRMLNAGELLSLYENLTLNEKDFNPDFIFWPEYSIAADLSVMPDLMKRVSNLAKEMDSYIVLGTFSFVDKNKIGLNDLKYDRVNIFSPEGQLIDYYDSLRIQSVNGDIIPSNDSRNIVNTEFGDFRIGVCYEEYIDSDNLKSIDEDFIIFLSNNQHFDNTNGIDLISQFSKLKALEEKKYVLRVSNTGITQIVNPYGKVEEKLFASKTGVLKGKIYI
jgi:apolipoprotein N-acyltransferase